MSIWDSDWKGVTLGLGTGNLGAGFSYYANKQQIDAANQAQEQQLALIREQQQYQAEQAEIARRLLGQEGVRGEAELYKYADQSQQAIQDARDRGLASISGASDAQKAALLSGAEGSLASLYGAQEQGASALGAGAESGRQLLASGLSGYEAEGGAGLTAAIDQLGQGLDQSRLAGLYSSTYAPSDDYAFRREAGERALERAASARGGRHGGAQLRRLSDFNQALASQDYADWAARQSAIGGQIDAQRMSVADQQAGLMTNYANALANQRQQTAYGQAGLSSTYGQGLADLYANTAGQVAGVQSALGGNLADVYYGAGSQAADLYGSAGGQRAAIANNLGTQLANLYASNATGQANILTGQAAQNANLSQAALPVYQAPVQYAGQAAASAGNTISRAGSDAASAWLNAYDKKRG